MPDLRAHGESAAPHDPAAYPSDILVQDARALMAHLNLSDFDIGGFSLGERTVAKLLVEGLQPRRAIVAGRGREGLSGWAKRREGLLPAKAYRYTVKGGDHRAKAGQVLRPEQVEHGPDTLQMGKSGGGEPECMAGGGKRG